MPPAEREALELLDLYAQQEQLLDRLYRAYQQAFPERAELWGRLAAEKRQHADWVQAFKQRVERGEVRYMPGTLHLKVLETHLANLRRNVEQDWQSPRSLDHALEIAMRIEKNIIQKSLFSSFKSSDPDLGVLLARLSDSTGRHYLELRELVLRRGKYSGLVERGVISLVELERALASAREQDVPVSRVLLSLSGVPKAALLAHLSDYFGVPSYQAGVDLAPPTALLERFGGMHAIFRRQRFVPVAEHDGTLVVAVEDPQNVIHRDAVRAAFQERNLEFRVAIHDDILATVELYFAPGEERDALGRALQELEVPAQRTETGLVVNEEDTAVVRLVNRIIEDAAARGASDIHLEPAVDGPLQVRLRIDGELSKTVTVPKGLSRVLISRLKIMAGLDITEHRLPQSGKIAFRDWGRADVELRLETYPTVGAEDAVMRILADQRPRALSELSLTPANEAALKRLLDQPYGIFLCVGPTGCGKTTTLHSALSYRNEEDVKILTVEDPVEIKQEGLRQVQVHTKAGLSFASALRSFLRADPDIIMVGEMRDLETASVAIASSLTGHLVLSTLHTNSAPETVTRLLEMGIDRFSFADSLLGILAQRLVRRLCPKCRRKVSVSPDGLGELQAEYGAGWESLALGSAPCLGAAGEGCTSCQGHGFRGRLAIHELMQLDDDVRQLITQQKSAREIRVAAIAGGMRTLRQDGIGKALRGDTTLDEVRAAASR